MKAAPPGTGENEAKKAEDEINNIYKKLQEGASFQELAKKYSDHKESASKEVNLTGLEQAKLSVIFLKQHFLLRDTGNYTKPVSTIYGWHIIKLLGKESSRIHLKKQDHFLKVKSTSHILIQ